jgi:hypothetical protein
MKLHEAGAGESASRPQLARLLLEQDHLLVPAGPGADSSHELGDSRSI